MPLVSVLIPVYNAGPYIGRCIDSVLQQSYENIEIILVDDGSEDESAEICQSYVNDHDNIHFYLIPHQGVSAARQMLVEKATGKLLFFLDADDYLSEHALELLHIAMLESDTDIVQCSMLRTDKDHEAEDFERYLEAVTEATVYEGTVAAAVFGLGTSKLRCMLAGKLYKAEILKAVRFPLGKIHEDEALMHHIFYAAGRVAFVDAPFYRYFSNEESLMKRKFSLERFDILEAIDNRIEFYRKIGLEKHAEVNELRYCWHIFELYRLSAEHFANSITPFSYLRECLQEKFPKLLKYGWLDEDIKAKLLSLYGDPVQGELFNYWTYAASLDYD